MGHLFAAMALLIEYPILAALIGALVLSLGLRLDRKTVIAVGVFWLFYAAYETGMKERWLCSGECNIRVDLLVIYPVLLAGLFAAAVSLFRARRQSRAG